MRSDPRFNFPPSLYAAKREWQEVTDTAVAWVVIAIVLVVLLYD